MSDVSLGALWAALVALILLSAFFSGSETGMIALNRYRLKHLAKHDHPGAKRASRLLERPERLIGLILLGNNFVNVLASVLASYITLRLVGEAGLFFAALVLTAVILIFAELAPKTLGALHPERVAFPAAYVLTPLLKLLYPIIAALNWMANGVLRLVGVKTERGDVHQLSSDELRTVVNEASVMISRRFRRMLLSILDLEKVTVDDIMVPRNEIHGIDLADSKTSILEQLTNSQHTLLPIYKGDINNIEGVLHMRKLLPAVRHQEFSIEMLAQHAAQPYFVPAGTPLNTQLLNFQRQHKRLGLVVDEYGDIDGLVTLEDILEEIVGEFTTDPAVHSPDIHPQKDGSYLIDASANVRDLNRTMHWGLPRTGPKTLNGLILEYLEAIPEPGTGLLLGGYPIEVVQTSDNAVKTVRIFPALRRQPRPEPGGPDKSS